MLTMSFHISRCCCCCCCFVALCSRQSCPTLQKKYGELMSYSNLGVLTATCELPTNVDVSKHRYNTPTRALNESKEPIKVRLECGESVGWAANQSFLPTLRHTTGPPLRSHQQPQHHHGLCDVSVTCALPLCNRSLTSRTLTILSLFAANLAIRQFSQENEQV